MGIDGNSIHQSYAVGVIKVRTPLVNIRHTADYDAYVGRPSMPDHRAINTVIDPEPLFIKEAENERNYK